MTKTKTVTTKPNVFKKAGNKIKDFWKGLKAEFKKINWPGKTTIIKQSTLVIAASVVIGTIIALLDMLFQYVIGLFL